MSKEIPQTYEDTGTDPLLNPLNINQTHELTLFLKALLLSIIADRARLIEAVCEDGKIVFRATELYNFPKDIEVAFPLFAQWFHGNPIGTET